MKRRTALLVAGLLLGAGVAGADPEESADPATPPTLLHYQGRFTDASGNPLPGPVTLAFRFHRAATGGTAIWLETHPDVQLDGNGVASILLGSVVSLPPDLTEGSELYLGVSVDGSAMLPRLRIASVPFALEAFRLNGKRVEDFEPRGSVLALSLSDGSPPNVGENRVHWDVLRGVPAGFADGDDAGVDDHGDLTGLSDDDHPQYAREADLAQSAGEGPNTGKNLVHWENLVGVPSGFADGADNVAEVSGGDHGELVGLEDDDHPQYALDQDLADHEAASDPHPGYAAVAQVTAHAADPAAHHVKTTDAGELTSGALDPARIPAGGIDGSHVADGSLTGDDLAAQSVTESDLADGSVTGVKVVDGSLTGDDIAVSSLPGDRLVPGTVTSAQLAPAAFDSTNIADGGISASDLAPGSVNSDKLVPAAVDSGRIAPAAVDSVHLAPGSVRRVHLGAASVGADQIEDGSVGTDEVKNESLTSADIKNGSLIAVDLLDEAGVDLGSDASTHALGASAANVFQETIFAPASGWILAIATATGCVTGPAGGGEVALTFSASAADGALDPAGRVSYRVDAAEGARHCAPLTSQVLFPAVSSSVVTVYVVAQGESGAAMDVSGISLSLLFLPTRY